MPIDEDPVWRTWNTLDGGQVIVKVVYREEDTPLGSEAGGHRPRGR